MLHTKAPRPLRPRRGGRCTALTHSTTSEAAPEAPPTTPPPLELPLRPLELRPPELREGGMFAHCTTSGFVEFALLGEGEAAAPLSETLTLELPLRPTGELRPCGRPFPVYPAGVEPRLEELKDHIAAAVGELTAAHEELAAQRAALAAREAGPRARSFPSVEWWCLPCPAFPANCPPLTPPCSPPILLLLLLLRRRRRRRRRLIISCGYVPREPAQVIPTRCLLEVVLVA